MFSYLINFTGSELSFSITSEYITHCGYYSSFSLMRVKPYFKYLSSYFLRFDATRPLELAGSFLCRGSPALDVGGSSSSMGSGWVTSLVDYSAETTQSPIYLHC